MRLNLAQRRLAREAARDAWIACDGKGDEAELLFCADPRIAKLDPMTIIAIIQIAFMLWDWWKKNHVKEPSVVAQLDEPGDWESEYVGH